MRLKISHYIFPITLALFAIALWTILTFHCQDILVKAESRSLFLTTGHYFRDRMLCVGGLLTYLSCFLTLFLQFPAIGSLIAVLLWCGVTLFTKKTFRLEGSASALAFLPAALLVAADMQSGYMIFAYREQGWFFISTLGYLTTLSAIFMHNRIKRDSSRLIFIIIWTSAAYPLSGFYALLGTAAIAVQSIASPTDARIRNAVISLIAIIMCPLFWSGVVYYKGRVAVSHLAVLPDIFDMSDFHALWIPYIALGAVTLAVAFLFSPTRKFSIAVPDIALYLTGTITSVLIVWFFWYKDPAYINELKMDNAMERKDWKEIVRIHDNDTRRFAAYNARVSEKRDREIARASSASYKDIIDEFEYKFHLPTRAMVLYKDLALLRSGISGSQAFMHADGDYTPPAPRVNPLVIQCGKQLYYNYGIPNYCYRWCIEDAVEFGWNVEILKYAVRSTMIVGDWDIAEKFIYQLEHSPFHRKWAKGQRELLHHPELIRESDEYRDVLPLMCNTHDISTDESFLERFLLDHFVAYNWLNSTAEGCEAAMLWTLRAQDNKAFWSQLANWMFTHPGADLPKHYQEAAYLFGQLEGRSTHNLKISPEIIRSYENFTKFVNRHPVHSEKEGRYIYGKHFGDTYYYYYFFVRDQQTH